MHLSSGTGIVRVVNRAPLTVEPLGGLCNRMRVIASGYGLAKKIDRPLRIAWRQDATLNCPFERLFDPMTTDWILEELLGYPLGQHANAGLIGTLLTQPEVQVLQAEKTDWVELADRDPLHIVSWSEFYHHEHQFEMLPPKLNLMQRVEDKLATLSARSAGVHVRRTDHSQSIAHNSIEDFIETMRAMLREEICDTFFLATDSPAAEARIAAALPGRVDTCPKRSLNRNRADAIEDALVDLYTLARQPCILGSYQSSFTQTACRLGGVVARFPAAIKTGTARRP